MEALAHPRWEDYEYTHVNANPCGWIGNGWTKNELCRTINVDYLNDENIDFPLVEKVVVNRHGHTVERGENILEQEISSRL